jgi:DNA-binding NarL/FixJ family response regulator
MSKVQFIVAEPSFIVRKGIVSLINEQPNAIVAREVDTAQRLAELVTHYSALALVININLLKSISGNELLKLTHRKNKLHLIALANSTDNFGNISKGVISSTILLDEPKGSVLKKLKQIINQSITHEDGQNDNAELSDREIEILKDVALGLSNKEIADKNFISHHTVITHRKNLTRKLGIKTVAGLTIYAIINKLIGMEAIE